MIGYYYDKTKHKYDYGEHPEAKPTMGEAMSARNDVPVVDISEEAPLADRKVEVAPEKETNAVGSGVASGAQALAKGSSPEDALSAGLMGSGEPIAMGAGMGLLALSSVNKAKQARAESRYLAEIRKQQARQEAINKMAQIGQNLKA